MSQYEINSKKCLLSKRNLFIIYRSVAGWSSQAARRAHNPKVVGSNPAPATKSIQAYNITL